MKDRLICVCDHCWELLRSGREPERVPHPEPAFCGICGNETHSGIYIEHSAEALRA